VFVGWCDAGEEPSTDQLSCVACPIGTYQPDAGQQACIQCTGGRITAQTGSTNSTDCIGMCPGEEAAAEWLD